MNVRFAPMKLAAAVLLTVLPLWCGATLTPIEFDSRARAADGQALRLRGHLARPSTAAPSPAVVMLHGCSGLLRASGEPAAHFRDIAALLVAQGYATLLVDSFTPRGLREICTQAAAQRAIGPRQRSLDAYGALDHLGSLPGIDATRIALIGWSHGGSTVLSTVLGVGAPGPDFAAAIAYYPGCRLYLERGLAPRAPLLLLLGGADDWTPASYCLRLEEELRGRGRAIEHKLYEGAHHGFDGVAPLRVRRDVPNVPGGATVGGDPAARADSQARLREFLHRWLAANPAN